MLEFVAKVSELDGSTLRRNNRAAPVPATKEEGRHHRDS